jgi:MerR family transcriptional regulator, copper efflux regulator
VHGGALNRPVREKLTELKGLERTLADFIKRCDAVCSGGPGPDCVILKDMADPMADSKCKVGQRKCR